MDGTRGAVRECAHFKKRCVSRKENFLLKLSRSFKSIFEEGGVLRRACPKLSLLAADEKKTPGN